VTRGQPGSLGTARDAWSAPLAAVSAELPSLIVRVRFSSPALVKPEFIGRPGTAGRLLLSVDREPVQLAGLDDQVQPVVVGEVPEVLGVEGRERQVVALGQLPGPPGAAVEFTRDSPGLELGIRPLAGLRNWAWLASFCGGWLPPGLCKGVRTWSPA
jgi:hypothetical protein